MQSVQLQSLKFDGAAACNILPDYFNNILKGLKPGEKGGIYFDHAFMAMYKRPDISVVVSKSYFNELMYNFHHVFRRNVILQGKNDALIVY